jgi:double-stranded uracil-DNA glycosylase
MFRQENASRATKAQLLAARGKTLADVIGPGLKVLFCGINPGLYTAAVGHHFARPGNRFWAALQAGGFTHRVFEPHEQRELLALGYGITNVVERATVAADELTREDLVEGGRRLVRKVRRYRPRVLAILGVGAYRLAFHRPGAQVGLQEQTIEQTRLWVLPNTSGLNAHYQAHQLADLFRQLRQAVDGQG